jgi:hypothetical protein
VALAAALAAAPAAALAQGGPYGVVTVATSYGYDANLLSSSATTGLESDEFARTGPTVEAGYASDLVRIGARYSFDADRYRRHGELNRMFAREEAGLRMRFVPSQRVRLSVDASYLMTTTPVDLNLDSLLAVGRTPATRWSGAGGVAFRATPLTDVTLDYAFGKDTLLGGVGSELHSVRGGVERRTAARDRVGLAYELRGLRFRDIQSVRGRDMFHVVTVRWRHELTPWTELDVEAGPHIGPDAVRPEISAVLRRTFGRGELSIGYARSQVTTIGQAGTFDVHRVSGGGTFRPARRLSITVMPAFAYTARDTDRIPVYTLDADATIEASNRLAIAFTSRLGRQEGALGGGRDVTPHQRFAVELRVALLRTARADGEWPAAAGMDDR